MAIAQSSTQVQFAVPRLSIGVEDLAFRKLLGEPAWRGLAPAIHARFGVKPLPGQVVEYAGRMTAVRASALGRLFGHLCRLIGSPIAPYTGDDVPISVFVQQAPDGAGVVWRREYFFPGRGKVTARSVKKVDGADSLLECFAAGFTMRMRVFAEGGSLHFLSTGYFVRLGRWRLPIPALLSPGQTHVIHADRGNGRFSFTMTVRHPLYGETFFQDGWFHVREQ
ncbi:MAG TPA: DUF4166 domain-containing protein [Verrucomicrobiae bacterium]|nr:DUF4166 domain-containing protein [Verrucomicrobiae bacterium]